MKRFHLLLILSLFVLSGCSFLGPKKEKITLETSKGKVVVEAEIADSEEERTEGLMNRDELPAGSGMLFVFEDETPRGFWMKNTLIPLDLIYLDGKKEVVTTVENMEPCKTPQCPTYLSAKPAMFALEVPAGFIKEYGVELGDKILDKE